MCFFGVGQNKIDIVSELPLEVGQLILRHLGSKSLLNAAQVSHTWLSICKSDNILRRRARHHLCRQKRRLYKSWLTPSAPIKITKSKPKDKAPRPTFKIPNTHHNFDIAKMIPAFKKVAPVKKIVRSNRLPSNYKISLRI